jgi:hypothetical protein
VNAFEKARWRRMLHATPEDLIGSSASVWGHSRFSAAHCSFESLGLSLVVIWEYGVLPSLIHIIT